MTQRSAFQRIGVREAEALLQRKDVLVLDVRDSDSFARGHIPGALNVSIASVSPLVEQTSKSTSVLIYCYHGYASQEYAQLFADFRFREVYSLDGGFEAWQQPPPATRANSLPPSVRAWLEDNGFPEGDLEATIRNETTPLMQASLQGLAETARALVAAGAHLDARNADGNNALWLACVGSHFEVIDVLVEAGVDIDNRNDNGATALMYAASSGKAPVVARLLSQGADTTPETLDGFSALDMAATLDCLNLLRLAARPQSKALAPCS